MTTLQRRKQFWILFNVAFVAWDIYWGEHWYVNHSSVWIIFLVLGFAQMLCLMAWVVRE